MCVCGALFRDLEWTKLKRKGHSNGSLGSKGSDQPCMPEIEELRALLETGGVNQDRSGYIKIDRDKSG